MSATWDSKGLKATPLSADEVLIIDTADSRNQKRATLSSLGVTNTTSNVGTGEGLALPPVGTDFPFKSLIGTAPIVLTGNANDVTFNLNPLTNADLAVGAFPNITATAAWTQSGTDVFPTTLTDFVGIRKNNPDVALDALGSIQASDTYLYADGSTQFQAAIPDGISGFVDTSVFHASFDVSAQGTAPVSVFFNPPGLKMYVLDFGTQHLDEYNLTTPFDITTASFSTLFLDVGLQDNLTNDFRFRQDGLKLYTIGSQNGRVYEWNLTTAFDVTSATISQNFIVSGQDPAPFGVAFRPDGKKMYVVGNTNTSIFEYDLTIPWDVTSASFSSKSFNVATQDNDPTHLHFRPDGTRMYLVGTQNDKVYDYDLSTPWDITSAIFSESLDVTAQVSDPRGIFLSTDNTKLYVVGITSNTVFEFDLGIKADLGKSIFGSVESNSIHALDAFVFSDDSTQSRGAIPVNHYGFLNTVIFNDSFNISAQDTDPRGITFNASGLKMYVLGVSSLRIYEYDLTAPYRVAGATLLQSLLISGIDTAPRALHLNPDGKILFMAGFQNKSVYRLDLSTANDITTAVLTQTLDVSAQDTIPSSITLTDDGDHLYMSGAANNRIYQYTLPTSYSIEEAIFTSFFAVTDDTNIQGVAVNPNATKMYLVGVTTNRVLQYDLTTPEDITTAVLEDTLAIGSQDSVPLGMYVSPDLGTLHITGRTNTSVYEYNFGIKVQGNSGVDSITGKTATMEDAYLFSDGSTQSQADIPLDIAGFVNTSVFKQSFNVSTQDALPEDMFIRPDGLKMYVVSTTIDSVFEYNLSTAWDVSTAAIFQSLSVAAQDGGPQGIFFRPDGLKMYITGTVNDRVFEYDLSTAWNILTASSSPGQSFSVAAQDTNPVHTHFRPDGKKMYVLGETADNVSEYDLSTPWIVNTSRFLQSFNIAIQDTSSTGMSFRSDGKKMYVLGTLNDSVFEYDLTTPWNITTSVFQQSFSVLTQDNNPRGVFLKPDDTKLYVVGRQNTSVYEYDLGIKVGGNSVFNDITASLITSGEAFIFPDSSIQTEAALPDGISGFINTSAFKQDFPVVAQGTTPTGVWLSPDGTKMYVLDGVTDNVSEYTLSTPGDVASASFDQSFNVGGEDSEPEDVFFKPDGSKMYILGNTTNSVYEYNLTTNFDLSTASFSQKSFSVANEETTPIGLYIRPDGHKMYVTGISSDNVNEYDLAIGFDISTAKFNQAFNIGEDPSPGGISFRLDGSKMYVIGVFNLTIFEYNLSTRWDVSTAQLFQSLDISREDDNPVNIFINSDATKFYIVGQANDRIYEYNLGIQVGGDINANLVTSIKWKEPVRVTTVANISLSTEQTIDGVTTSEDRILVKNQTTASENGIYLTTAGDWTRTTDFDDDTEVLGSRLQVLEGTLYGGVAFRLTNTGSITIGTTSLTFKDVQDTSTIVNVRNAEDWGAPATAPDGVSRVPLVNGTTYFVHTTHTMPRVLMPIIADEFSFGFVEIAFVNPTSILFIDGDTIPHFWGRNVGGLIMKDPFFLDSGNSFAGEVSTLFDLVGFSDLSTLVVDFGAFTGFRRLGSTVGMFHELESSVFQNNLGGLVVRSNGIGDDIHTHIYGPMAFIHEATASAPVKPILSFQGKPFSVQVFSSNVAMVAGQDFMALDSAFATHMEVLGNPFDGTGNFFAQTEAVTITASVNADIAFASVAAGAAGFSVITFSAIQDFTIGQTILIKGDTGTTYDGLHEITSVSDDQMSFTIAVTFVATDTGNFKIVKHTVATNHPLVRGETITITGTTNYNATLEIIREEDGFIYTPQTFVSSQSGTATINPLNQTDAEINAQGNGDAANSENIGSFIVSGNTTATSISTADTFTDLNLGANAVAGSNIERWTLTNTTTGELRYDGERPFSGMISAVIVVEPPSSKEYHIRSVKNGSVLADDVVSKLAVSTVGTIAITVPLTAVETDLIRFQILEVGSTENPTISEMSVNIQ